MIGTIHLTLQKEVPVIIAMVAGISIACVIIGNKIKNTDPFEKPKGIVMMACWLVEIIDNNVSNIVDKKHVKRLAPYIGTIAIFIFLSNISGLFGIFTPTQNYSVTLTLALITWIMIQYTCIKENGVGSYFHGYIEPFAVLLIPNIFGRIAPLISMSLRLFGNVLSGAIIMSLVYTFTGFLSSTIIGLFAGSAGILNFLGPLLAPALHAYFDVFSGFIQMFIFITLTMVFIGNELPQE